MWRFRFIIIPLLVVPLAGFVVMSLWNWLAPAILGVGMITFWQAVGILILLRILFGGPGRYGRYFHRGYAFQGYGNHYGHRGAMWRMRMYRKWQNMTPEQKRKYARFYGCNYGDPEGPADTKKDTGSSSSKE